MIIMTVVINAWVYESMKAQLVLRRDKSKATLDLNIQDVEKLLPPLPNVDIAAMPISVYKVPYLLKEGLVEEALEEATKADQINPYTKVGNYFKARIYLFSGDLDQALFHAKEAYYGWPKNLDHYKVINEVLASRLDTTQIKEVFKHADSLFPEKKAYREDFEKSLNLARAGYIIKIYLDAEALVKDSLVGQWQRMYEYSYGKIVYDPNTVLSFNKSGVFKDTKGADYLYELEGTELSLLFKGNGQKIKTLNLSYSPGNNTLILIDPSISEQKPQYFKKISSIAVDN